MSTNCLVPSVVIAPTDFAMLPCAAQFSEGDQFSWLGSKRRH